MNINTVIQLSIFIITIGTLIWKLSTLNSKVYTIEDSVKLAHNRIDNYRAKFETIVEEFRAQISSLTQTLTKIEEKLNYIIKVKDK